MCQFLVVSELITVFDIIQSTDYIILSFNVCNGSFLFLRQNIRYWLHLKLALKCLVSTLGWSDSFVSWTLMLLTWCNFLSNPTGYNSWSITGCFTWGGRFIWILLKDLIYSYITKHFLWWLQLQSAISFKSFHFTILQMCQIQTARHTEDNS